MLNLFVEWARQFVATNVGKVAEARVAESEISDNPSARLDLDTPTAVARITCWRTGDYDAEVIELETARTLYSSHGALSGGQVLSEQFAPFFEVLGIARKDLPN